MGLRKAVTSASRAFSMVNLRWKREELFFPKP